MEELLEERNILFEKLDISIFFIDLHKLSRENKALLLSLTHLKKINHVSISLLEKGKIGYIISLEEVTDPQEIYNIIEIFQMLEHQDVTIGRLTLEQFLEKMDFYLNQADDYTKYQYSKGIYTTDLIDRFNQQFQTDLVLCPKEGTYWEHREDYEKHVKYLYYHKK